MKLAALVAVVTALAGVGLGWMLRGEPTEKLKIVRIPSRPTEDPKPVAQMEPKALEYPKPTLQTPAPSVDPALPAPSPLIGELPRLPAAGPTGAIGPVVPPSMPAADLNADEATARRIVLQSNGEIVSTDDARDTSGKVGRTLVVESSDADRDRLKLALRRSLGDRVVLSDGGRSEGTSAAIRKEEESLLALRKQRDQARIDFLPNAPTLLDLEEEVQKRERNLGSMRRESSRARLNVLVRPLVGG